MNVDLPGYQTLINGELYCGKYGGKINAAMSKPIPLGIMMRTLRYRFPTAQQSTDEVVNKANSYLLTGKAVNPLRSKFFEFLDLLPQEDVKRIAQRHPPTIDLLMQNSSGLLLGGSEYLDCRLLLMQAKIVDKAVKEMNSDKQMEFFESLSGRATHSGSTIRLHRSNEGFTASKDLDILIGHQVRDSNYLDLSGNILPYPYMADTARMLIGSLTDRSAYESIKDQSKRTLKDIALDSLRKTIGTLRARNSKSADCDHSMMILSLEGITDRNSPSNN